LLISISITHSPDLEPPCGRDQQKENEYMKQNERYVFSLFIAHKNELTVATFNTHIPPNSQGIYVFDMI